MRGQDLTSEEIIQISKRIVRLYKEKNVFQYVKTTYRKINCNKNIINQIYISQNVSLVYIELIWDVFYDYYRDYEFYYGVPLINEILSSISASFVSILFADNFINETDSEKIKKELEISIKDEFSYLIGRFDARFIEDIRNDKFIKDNNMIKILKDIEKKYNIPEYYKILI